MAFDITPPKREQLKTVPRRTEQRALWRLTAWGGAAALALATLAVTTQTDTGAKRLQLALAPPAAPTQVVAAVPPPPRDKDAETRALEAQLRRLTADRDRLANRLSTIEHHLEDITGSIQRQEAQHAAAPTPAPASSPADGPAPAPAASAPAPAAQAATAAATDHAMPSKPEPAPEPAAAPEAKAEVAPAPSTAPTPVASAVFDPLAMAPGTESDGSWPDQVKALMVAPPLTESKDVDRLPPIRLAAIPASAQHVPQPPVPPRAVAARHEYGIELGVAPNVEKLRQRWAAVKANHGPLLEGLQPIAVRETRPGAKHVRLIAGPMPNLAAARQACARLVAARAACRPARFSAALVIQQ